MSKCVRNDEYKEHNTFIRLHKRLHIRWHILKKKIYIFGTHDSINYIHFSYYINQRLESTIVSLPYFAYNNLNRTE